MGRVPLFPRSLKLSLRKAGSDDVDAVVALVNSAYRGESSRVGWTTEADLLGGQRTDADEVRKLIEADGSMLWLCFEDGELIGSVHLQKDNGGAYLGMLAVKPGLQGRGVGKAFVESAERIVRSEWGSTRMLMTVITLRAELIAYYERRGYRRTGEIRAFPSSPKYGEPHVAGLELEVLEKALG